MEQEPFSFGVEEESISTGGNNQRFTSYDHSAATGLDYAVNRHYDPQQGRFTQVDPLGMGAANLANPQSLNMYAYVQNDPVNVTDPMGLKETEVYCEKNPDGKITCYEVITVVASSKPSRSLTGGRGLLPTGGPREGGGRAGDVGAGGGRQVVEAVRGRLRPQIPVARQVAI